MRIKSSFHDYYDSIQSYFQNSGLLYLREPKEFTFERYNQFLGREADKESFFQEYLKYVGRSGEAAGLKIWFIGTRN